MTSPDHPAPLLPAAELAQLRVALAGYTVDAVTEILGPAGDVALRRGDLAGARHAVAATGADGQPAGLTRLFVLGEELSARAAAAALAPLDVDAAVAAGLVAASAGGVRALLDVRPYSESVPALPGAPGAGPDWWVVSDLGTQFRDGPVPDDHVLGIGTAALTLAQATVREPAARALDIGTGCGVQALHLSRHSEHVVATDISLRALRMAATTAVLSGTDWELRRGSFTAPVDGESFDVIVSNPPFVVSPGWSAGSAGLDYRDSGLAGDEVCRHLVGTLPGLLAPGGQAQLLANWVITGEQDWPERLRSWLPAHGCDAWVWQREVADPAEYVALWLRDANEDPASPRYLRRYEDWLGWFERQGVAGIGMGLISLWRTDRADPVVVCDDVPQPVEQPAGPAIAAWHRRASWLATSSDDDLLRTPLVLAPGVVLTHDELCGPDGWAPAGTRLRQSHGMRWELDVDRAISTLLAGFGEPTVAAVPIAVLAATLDRPADEIAGAVTPVLQDLVRRGFLDLAGGGRA